MNESIKKEISDELLSKVLEKDLYEVFSKEFSLYLIYISHKLLEKKINLKNIIEKLRFEFDEYFEENAELLDLDMDDVINEIL